MRLPLAASDIAVLPPRLVRTTGGVTYAVRIFPAEHELLIEMRFEPPEGAGAVDLEIPSWTPGSYRFRPLGRNIFGVAAFSESSGRRMPCHRQGWQGYRVEGVDGPLRVTWHVAAYDVEQSQLLGLVGDDVAVLSAANFFYSSGYSGGCRVTYSTADQWRIHTTGPALRSPGTAIAWDYPSYESLLDSPVVLGNFTRICRDVDGTRFYFVFIDRTIGFDAEAANFVEQVARAARECRKVFGSFPFPSYTFILTSNPDLRWGLEHLTSSVCSIGPDVFIDSTARARAVRTCAHELFHAWNVRRLRPKPFGRPFDLTRGTFTDGLWLAEGFTRYYEHVVCVRAGIYSGEEFISSMVNNWDRIETTPAYAAVSATDSSLATFVNHGRYRNSANTSIDYYQKGMLMAFALDVDLRLAGDSLDAALRDFYSAFAQGGCGYSTHDALAFFARRHAAAGTRLARAALCPGGLGVGEQLQRLGFRVSSKDVGFLGIALSEHEPVIRDVYRGSAAGRSGLAPGDQILGLNGFRFSPKALEWAAGRNEVIVFEVLRGHRHRTFTVVPAHRSTVGRVRWMGTPADARRIREWLGTPDFPPDAAVDIDLSFYENFHRGSPAY